MPSKLRYDVIESLNRFYTSGGTMPQQGLGDLLNDALADVSEKSMELYIDNVNSFLKALKTETNILSKSLPISRTENLNMHQQSRNAIKILQAKWNDLNNEIHLVGLAKATKQNQILDELSDAPETYSQEYAQGITDLLGQILFVLNRMNSN